MIHPKVKEHNYGIYQTLQSAHKALPSLCHRYSTDLAWCALPIRGYLRRVTQPSILIFTFQSCFLPCLLPSKWCLCKKMIEGAWLPATVFSGFPQMLDTWRILEWPYFGPAEPRQCTSQPVAKWPWKLIGCSTVGKPDNMMDKAHLVHFKTMFYPCLGN